MNSTSGKVIIPAGAATWPHELSAYRALAEAGFSVKVLPITHNAIYKTADVEINKVKWELKSPKSDKLSAIERNLKRASKQSNYIIIDSLRIKRLHDSSIQSFLLQKYKQQASIKGLLFINRHRTVIDIKDVV